MIHFRILNLINELTFKASRSKGPGGQNVNKVNTRVELRFNINNSTILTNSEKEQLENFFRSRITEAGEIIIVSQTSRSQLMNKDDATTKFISLIETALLPKKERKQTRPTRASKFRRLKTKRKRAEKKILRNNNKLSFD